MDDVIVEKDYRRKPEDICEGSPEIDILNQAINGSFFEEYTAAMDAIPKVIVPKDKENFEYLSARCDELAQRHHGYFRSIVDYHKWDSHIEVLLPFAEFGCPEELALLKEIAEKSSSVLFEPVEEGIRLYIMINYFEELMSEEHRSFVQYNAIMNDETLAAMLHMPELSPEMDEVAQQMNDILDRFENETQYDRTTIFKALLERVAKFDEKNQTFDKMLALAEQLLEAVLNEQADNTEEEE